MSDPTRAPKFTDSSPERRRSPRIELLGELRGDVVSLSTPVTVRDISLGGMAIETGSPMTIGAIHTLRFDFPDEPLVVSVRVLGCRIRTTGTGHVYISDLEFLDKAGDVPTSAQLIDKITADLSFDFDDGSGSQA